jgi:hypothetical protein
MAVIWLLLVLFIASMIWPTAVGEIIGWTVAGIFWLAALMVPFAILSAMIAFFIGQV